MAQRTPRQVKVSSNTPTLQKQEGYGLVVMFSGRKKSQNKGQAWKESHKGPLFHNNAINILCSCCQENATIVLIEPSLLPQYVFSFQVFNVVYDQ